jgi:hypothetical protein
MKGRTRGAPLEERGHCPSCGRKGLGNTYHAACNGGRRPYRQCTYCQEIAWQAPPPKTKLQQR